MDSSGTRRRASRPEQSLGQVSVQFPPTPERAGVALRRPFFRPILIVTATRSAAARLPLLAPSVQFRPNPEWVVSTGDLRQVDDRFPAEPRFDVWIAAQ